jgi:hypothetical protein
VRRYRHFIRSIPATLLWATFAKSSNKLKNTHNFVAAQVFLATKIAHPNVGAHQLCDYITDPKLSAFEVSAPAQ